LKCVCLLCLASVNMMLRLTRRSLVTAVSNFINNIEHWNRDGFVVLKSFISQSEVQDMTKYVEEVQNWRPCRGRHMHYFEKDPSNYKGFMLTRTENYLDFHLGLAGLFGDNSKFADMAAQLLKDPRGAVVFKERINYKLAGGAGFLPHQDAPAWSGLSPLDAGAELPMMKQTLNMIVAVDKMTQENGGLEMVRGFGKKQLLPQKADGTLTDEFCSAHDWEPVVLEPGDVCFFSLHVPHRSGPNHTSSSRRAVYITYAGQSVASRQDKLNYYKEYREKMPAAGEQDADCDYSEGNEVYNWATPILGKQPSSDAMNLRHA